MAARSRKAAVATWRDVELTPIVLVAGPEPLFADRAVERLRRLCRDAAEDVDVVTVAAPGYETGQLAAWTSPSLFGERRLVVVEDVEQAPEPLFTDALRYLDDVADDVVLVLRHGGGPRGKKLLDAVRAASAAVVVDCSPLTRDADRLDFVSGEFRRAGRKATRDAVTALLQAVGGDLRELAAACSQLVSDVPGDVDVQHVDLYYGGRAEVTGFRVADAAVAGQRELALRLLRQAVASGVDPLPLIGAMAMKLRTMVKVGAAGRGASADLARELGLKPWQVDRARRELQGWTPNGLAAGLLALAEADAAAKGAGRDAVYAVERTVIRIADARR